MMQAFNTLLWAYAHIADILQAASFLVSSAAVIAALPPSPKDDGWAAKARQILDLIAFNFGHAKKLTLTFHNPLTHPPQGGFFMPGENQMAVTNQKIRSLQAKKAAKVSEARALLTAADSSGHDFDDEQAKQYGALKAEIDALQAAIERETELAALESDIDPRAAGVVTVHDNREDDPKLGFKNLGDFAAAVMRKSIHSDIQDSRLRFEAAAPGSYAGEGAGADGGFLIPPEFSREIWQYSLDQGGLLQYTENTEVGGNSMVFPKDETVPWGTDGITAQWQAEATAATAQKPVLGTDTLRLHKLISLVPVTEELLQDTTALTSYLPKKIGSRISWKADESILFGTGAGQPKGALVGSGTNTAMLVVAKDSGQAANTLTTLNLANIIARLPPGSYQRSVWLINNDVLPALFTLTLGNYPIYLPIGAGQGGVMSSPFIGVLLGRPVLITQHAKSFSSQGDVNLVDLSYYRTLTKAGGIQTDTSMHLYFDAAATAFRAIFRLDGQPIISKQITPQNGSNKLSPFVQLGAR